jgi:hypothetical protein
MGHRPFGSHSLPIGPSFGLRGLRTPAGCKPVVVGLTLAFFELLEASMPRDTKSRDVTLSSLSVLTGGLTAAALVGTGVVMGMAADQTAHTAQVKAESEAAVAGAAVAVAPVRPFVLPRAQTPRPTRTVVTTKVVPAAPDGGGDTSGGASGGSASSTSGGSSGAISGGSSSGSQGGSSAGSSGGSYGGSSGTTSGGSSSGAGAPAARAPAPVAVRPPAPAPAPAPPPAPPPAPSAGS